VRKEDTVRLDAHYLNRRIEVLGLKQGWVADRLGVARKTVSRWATGKVKRLARDNAEALAEVLQCGLGDLTVSDEVDVLATKEEQRVAATLIQESDLLGKLSPSDDWALAEGLIKASLQPDLPLADVGRLYNLLSTAAWRQGHYEEGVRRAARALALGEQLGERTIVAGARMNQAVIDSLCGDLGAALAAYEALLAEPEALASKLDHAKVLSNVGDAYRSFLRFEEGILAQEDSIRLFGELGLDLNLAISCVSLGNVLLEGGRPADALEAYEQAEDHARRARYARGVDCAPIYQADARSLGSDQADDPAATLAAARDLVVRALPYLAQHKVYDLGCHVSAARVLRRAGDLEGAASQVAEGLERAGRFPELRAAVHLEEARLASAQGDGEGEARARASANEAHREADLIARVLEAPAREHGAGAGPGS
jgi:tetratricopeptide (TPR) repeat protein